VRSRPSADRRHAGALPAALAGVLALTLIALVPLTGTAPLLRFAGQAALIVAVLPAAWLLVRMVTAAVDRLAGAPDHWTAAPAPVRLPGTGDRTPTRR
jgi:hypothetical protein